MPTFHAGKKERVDHHMSRVYALLVASSLKNWSINQEIFNTINDLSYKIASTGNDAQRIQHWLELNAAFQMSQNKNFSHLADNYKKMFTTASTLLSNTQGFESKLAGDIQLSHTNCSNPGPGSSAA